MFLPHQCRNQTYGFRLEMTLDHNFVKRGSPSSSITDLSRKERNCYNESLREGAFFTLEKHFRTAIEAPSERKIYIGCHAIFCRKIKITSTFKFDSSYLHRVSYLFSFWNQKSTARETQNACECALINSACLKRHGEWRVPISGQQKVSAAERERKMMRSHWSTGGLEL